MVYDSKNFPYKMREKFYEWLRQNLASEKNEGQTEEQFLYKTRKKALGPFKKDILGLSEDIKAKITDEVESKFEFLFDKLKIANTRDLVLKYAPSKPIKIDLKEEHVEAKLDGEGDD